MLVDRDPGREVKHLEWRIRLFGGGAVLAAVGLYFQSNGTVWAAIALLAVGFLLRFLPSSNGEVRADDSSDSEVGEDESSNSEVGEDDSSNTQADEGDSSMEEDGEDKATR